MSMKNSNDTIGNQTRDLPTCSAVPQPTALPRAPVVCVDEVIMGEYGFRHIRFTSSQIFSKVMTTVQQHIRY